MHTLMINLPNPGPSNKLLEFLYKLCRFDIIPFINDIYDWLSSYEENIPLNARFNEIGYKSQYIPINLGT
jgi:hypothetical protein